MPTMLYKVLMCCDGETLRVANNGNPIQICKVKGIPKKTSKGLPQTQSENLT